MNLDEMQEYFVVTNDSEKRPKNDHPMGIISAKSMEEAKESIENSGFTVLYIMPYKRAEVKL